MRWQSHIDMLKKIALIFLLIQAVENQHSFAQSGINDTLVTYGVVYNGDTIEAKTLLDLPIYSWIRNADMEKRSKWTRLRNAIIVTYPYALRSGMIMNELNTKLIGITDKEERKAIIKTREKELKKEFTEPLTNLSVYQGKVLMKLINRETGNNCYQIIKDYKGGLTARFYQTIAFFFSSSLKQNYYPFDEDYEMEMILKEVCRTYGYTYMAVQMSSGTTIN